MKVTTISIRLEPTEGQLLTVSRQIFRDPRKQWTGINVDDGDKDVGLYSGELKLANAITEVIEVFNSGSIGNYEFRKKDR